MPLPEQTHVLLATLGGQPQVVTFTLDLLLMKGFPITEVVVIHPEVKQQRLQRSLARLQTEFKGSHYYQTEHKIHLHSHPLQFKGKPVDDILDDYHADATLDTLHALIGKHKTQGHQIHLSVTGGRRLISLLALSVAVFNFDRYDNIWHIYTPEEVKEEAHEGTLMHVPPSAGVRLIKGPFITLSSHIYPQVSFHHAQEIRRKQMDTQEYNRCAEVYYQATPAQRKVLEAYSDGMDTNQIAEKLSITRATVKSHKKILLQLCRSAWSIEEPKTINYRFLQSRFASYFQSLL